MFKPSTLRIAVIAGILFVVLTGLQHHKSYTADEVFELRNLSTNWWMNVERPDGFPPLFSWLLSQFTELATASNARLFSAMTSVIGLLFVVAAGRCWGESVGIRAALLYVVSACQLEYAQQVRAYSLFICLAAMVLWAAIKTVQHQRNQDWGMLVVTSVASLWVHYYAAPYLVVVWLGVLIIGWQGDHTSQRRKRFLLRFVLAGICNFGLLLPWLYPLWIDLQNPPPIEAINAVDLTGIAYTYVTLIQGWCAGPSQLELFEWSKSQAILSIAPWAALSSSLFFSLAFYACRGRATKNKNIDSSATDPQADLKIGAVSIWMLTTVVAVPLVAAMLALLANSSYVPRYMASLVVPVSLLFGLGSRLQGWNWRTFCSWGLIAMNLLSFVSRNFADRYDRENYRELVRLLVRQEQSPKLLVLSHYLGNAIAYEAKGSLQLIMVGLNSDEPDNWQEIRTRVSQEFAGSERFWIAADWMRSDDLRLAKRDTILAQLGARHVARISGTLDLFLVTSTN